VTVPGTDDSEAEIDRRVMWRATAIAALFLFPMAVVNALTLIADAERFGIARDPRHIWLLEVSSIVVIVALIPALALWERRFPLEPGRWPTLIAAHVAGSLVYSLLHIVGMAAVRVVLFRVLFGVSFDVTDDPLGDLIYEYRKDVLTYALGLTILTILRALEEQRRDAATARAEARSSGRLTLKSGGRTLMLDAGAVAWARAAGNYVELSAGGRTHLARTTLATLEQQLAEAGADMARVHRSLLVSRAAIAETIPAGDGDLRIRLADGTELRGSRRYRQNLGA
jgi:hypothetical protein